MRSTLTWLFAILLIGCFLFSCTGVNNVDILIRHATIFDGSGSDSFKADIGISGDRIVFIGDASDKNINGKEIINAEGLIVAPGFIDPHTHTEKSLSSNDSLIRGNIPYLAQGVTTVFAGNDGESPLPLSDKFKEWTEKRIGTNAALFIGQGSVRGKVVGDRDVPPTPEQLKAMKEMVAQGMKDGALGLSTGLFYAPGSYANTEEVIELAKETAPFDGVYDTHMRHQSAHLMDGIRETIRIGKEAGIAVHISHIKADGPVVWNKSDSAIKLIEEARKNGIEVTANVYPYLASRTTLKARLIPRWAEDGGDEAMLRRFDQPKTLDSILKEIRSNIDERGGGNKVVISLPGDSFFHNRSIKEIAADWKIAEEKAVIKILRTHTNVSAHSFVMQEYDMVNFLKQPWSMVGSDGSPGGHPRAYGTFPKVIRELVLDKKIIPMKDAVHRSSGLTAATFGLKDRGLIKEGLIADIIAFDPGEIADKATYENPTLLAEGMKYVLVNGEVAIRDGKYTGALAGKILKK